VVASPFDTGFRAGHSSGSDDSEFSLLPVTGWTEFTVLVTSEPACPLPKDCPPSSSAFRDRVSESWQISGSEHGCDLPFNVTGDLQPSAEIPAPGHFATGNSPASSPPPPPSSSLFKARCRSRFSRLSESFDRFSVTGSAIPRPESSVASSDGSRTGLDFEVDVLPPSLSELESTVVVDVVSEELSSAAGERLDTKLVMGIISPIRRQVALLRRRWTRRLRSASANPD